MFTVDVKQQYNTVQVKVWKFGQPISGAELTVLITLLTDWRCWHCEIKRQNVTVCVYSNSRNDVPRVAQLYGTISAHTLPSSFVCSVLRARVQFCQFDKVDATADVQWHCNHRPPLWYHYFPAQSSLGADILVYWMGKIVRTCAPGGSRTLDFLCARRAPYPPGQALRFCGGMPLWYLILLI